MLENRLFRITLLLLLFSASSSCSRKTIGQQGLGLNVNTQLAYCVAQAKKAIKEIPAYDRIPRRIAAGSQQWEYVPITDWTSGFWPGTLWYLYEYQRDASWKEKAQGFTQALEPVLGGNVWDHDLGFMFYCSYGNGYRLTQNPTYRQVLLRAADSLASLYNPTVGTILSWPSMVKKMGWPHNTIMDNMINLELLFWAAKNGGGSRLYEIAVKHAQTTRQYHFRPDHTSYHVAVYDDQSGQFLKGVTHQGYADNTMWARGQAWAIYGFTMSYRESGNAEFLETAQKSADVFLENLPADHIPYWDFNAPDIPAAPKDASAAAITASALLELSTLSKDPFRQKKYRRLAETMLTALSSEAYLSKEQNNAFLLHSTGHKPNGTEIDVSINYADYYYLEALLRLKKLQEGKPLH